MPCVGHAAEFTTGADHSGQLRHTPLTYPALACAFLSCLVVSCHMLWCAVTSSAAPKCCAAVCGVRMPCQGLVTNTKARHAWPFIVLCLWQEENQGIDRVHRIGQEHDVTVHKLLMAGTVEPVSPCAQLRNLQK